MSKIIAVSGMKNSGKTTLIEGLIPVLGAKGIVTAVIKHDGHSYTPDVPGTDSYRFFEAGACGSAIFDGEKFTVTHRAKITETMLAAMFPEADLILLEGFKASDYPKLILVRGESGGVPAVAGGSVLAIVTELPAETSLPVFSPNDLEGIADFLIASL